jgi:hypothetical protein
MALLPQLGCRPGRVIHVRKDNGAEPATGQPYKMVIDGADAAIAPTGTVVDVLVDADGAPDRPPPPPPEPEPPPDSAYPDLPRPDNRPGCSHKVTTGPLEGVASCWRRRGTTYETTGRARVNGVDLTPARPGIAIRFEARRQRISSTGRVEVRIGFLHLYRGTLDWRGRSQVFSITGQSGGQDPGEPFDVKDVQVFGLPVDGSAELRFADGRTRLKASVKIPSDPGLAAIRGLSGWSGDLTAAATNDAGLVLDGATVQFPGIRAGFVEVSNAKLAVTRTPAGIHHFDGAATVYPFRFARMGLSGELGFGAGDGYFKIGAGVEQLNRMLVYGFFLQRIAFSAQVNPFGLSGAAGVTFGPQFRLDGSLVSAARLDGSLSYLSGSGGSPAALELAGSLKLAEADVADGKVKVRGGGLIDVEGTARFTLGGYGLTAGVNGWVDGRRAFNAEGEASVAIPGPDGAGEAVLSTKGIGACRRGFGAQPARHHVRAARADPRPRDRTRRAPRAPLPTRAPGERAGDVPGARPRDAPGDRRRPQGARQPALPPRPGAGGPPARDRPGRARRASHGDQPPGRDVPRGRRPAGAAAPRADPALGAVGAADRLARPTLADLSRDGADARRAAPPLRARRRAAPRRRAARAARPADPRGDPGPLGDRAAQPDHARAVAALAPDIDHGQQVLAAEPERAVGLQVLVLQEARVGLAQLTGALAEHLLRVQERPEALQHERRVRLHGGVAPLDLAALELAVPE